jgi:spermidine synthase
MGDPPAQRLAVAHTERGELVLRQRGAVLELISNGTFLMDTSGGNSEQAMATLALHDFESPARVLVAGLGFGFTLAAALEHRVTEVVVVEVAAEVIEWNRRWWPPAAQALADPRVRVVVADFTEYAARAEDAFDAVLVDIDNGPEWTVAASNDALYDGLLPSLREIVRPPTGRLCVWSASASAEFAARLGRHFARVTAHEIPVPRGEPDVLYLATG